MCILQNSPTPTSSITAIATFCTCLLHIFSTTPETTKYIVINLRALNNIKLRTQHNL
eukprot:m.997 g.997  ORF g.997 m.997 type:complete len:57 (-) comp505_c0_seq1:12-182(-)